MPKFKRKTKEERENEIREAAAKVFARKGFRNTTMEDIISETSLSKGGVYRYFSSPKDILISIMETGNESIFDTLKIVEIENTEIEDLPELLAEKTVRKIYDDRPLKRIYVIFLSELIYDKNLVKAHEEIERKNIERITGMIRKKFPEIKPDKNRMELSSKLMIGLLYFNSIFEGENDKGKREMVMDIFRKFYTDMLL